jgi:3-dehydroquinate dehydratase-2
MLAPAMKILVLHGPNLNLFGRREPSIYGTTTFDEINQRIARLAAELGAEVEIYQSNHEGALLDKLQARIGDCDGCVINAGALTHTSIALADCVKAMPFPCVEVHMSNVSKRESFRHYSYLTPVVEGVIAGLGWRGYLLALRFLVESALDRGSTRS